MLGREYPIRAVAELAHRVGAVLVVDGAQSTPHLPVNVQELGADFLAFSGHKLYGPMGIGALYGRRELLEEMPPFLTGGEMIESVTREGAVFAEAPHKFEAGTVNAAGAAGLHAAIDYVERVGFDTIHARELAVTADALARMRALPHVRILGSGPGGGAQRHPDLCGGQRPPARRERAAFRRRRSRPRGASLCRAAPPLPRLSRHGARELRIL